MNPRHVPSTRRLGHTRHSRWIAPLALALGVALSFVNPADRAGAAAGAAPKPGAGSGRLASGSRDRPMPDTVLAQVADGRVVTLSGFHAAWRQVKPPDRPDSLTPANARKFLDLLVDKEALAEAALRESWVWTDRESAEYNATRDGLTMKVVLDSVLAGIRSRIVRARPASSAPDSLTPIALGIAARESTAVALGVRFEADVLERLTRAFAAIPKPAPESALMKQLEMMGVMPVVDSTLHPRTVAHTVRGPYTVSELLSTWKALSPVYRPRVASTQDMEDVIENQLFERELRAAVERRRIADWPHIAHALARKREFIAISHLVAREVYTKIAMDSVTLHRYYTANRSFWDLPFRVALARFVMPTEQAGLAIAQQISDAARAESLIARGARAGARYMMEVSAESDSALFARAMRAGPGSVLGPSAAENGWEVIRVMTVNPARSRTFQECRTLVGNRWYGVEGERLMVELLARCRRETQVAIHEAAVQRLASP